jgi:hypothetical protein
MSVVLTWTWTEERGKPNDLESVCSLICRVLFSDAAHHRPGTSWHVGICKHWWQSNAQTFPSSSYERESEKNRFSSEVKASVSHHELRTERMPPLDPNAQRSAVVVVVVVTKNLLDPNNEQKNRWRERPERKGRPTPPRSKPHKRRGETACEYEQGTCSGCSRHGTVHAVGEDKRACSLVKNNGYQSSRHWKYNKQIGRCRLIRHSARVLSERVVGCRACNEDVYLHHDIRTL